MKGYFIDEQSEIVTQCFAIIYAPRRQRTRFPENVVEVVVTEVEAKNKADNINHYYPAIVVGPARSSEGLNMFYLVKWLDDK